jgi:thioesterase domain-containing protein
LMACESGCGHPAGNELTPKLSTSPHGGRVILLRGFQDWYSNGIDALASELQARGIDARAYPEDHWRDVADALANESESEDEPLVLVGFSYGADDVIEIANELSAKRRYIDLLVTIDPVTPEAVPGNVARCVNYFQSNGPWDALPWLRGIPLERADDSDLPLENIDIRRRPDLIEPNTSHATIAANRKLHSAIVERVLSVCRGRGR